MELIDYVRMVGRHWIWVALLALAGLVVGIIYAISAPKSYSATAELFIGSVAPERTERSSVEAESASRFVLDRMESYATFVDTPEVTGPVIDRLGLESTPDELGARLTATAPARTVVLRVTAKSGDARSAALTADAAANALGDRIEQIESATQGGVSPVVATLTRPAAVPEAPASPNGRLALLLGLLVGTGLGLVAASLREQASRRPVAPNGVGPTTVAKGSGPQAKQSAP